ncbi:MAG: hypothetical protein HC905_09965 [Bacteroidales bacterium]|nr:hypothetical protein [Bacteroidales bacterium]
MEPTMVFSYDLKTRKFKNYNSNHGFSDHNIISILDDGNQNIWLGTYTGLSRLDKKTGKVENFSFNDELQGNIYTRGAIMKDSNGDIFFGGTNGFIVVDPRRIKKDRFLAPIYITDIRVNDQSMQLNQFEKRQKHTGAINTLKELRLTNNENSYTLKFAALDYVDAYGLQYYYRLTGFDKNWRKAGARERMATYTNLDPGTYTFEVYATSDQYANSSSKASLNIIILPPWWKTWWAYIIYAVFLSGIFWLYFRFQKIRLKYKNDLYYEKLQREKEHETHQLKVGFFTQVSHEFRTPLTLISGPLQKCFPIHRPTRKPQPTCSSCSAMSTGYLPSLTRSSTSGELKVAKQS